MLRVLYTTEYLLNNASIVTELCIKSKEEYRLWQELKRINSLIDNISKEIKDEFLDLKGFSPRNLKYMRKFAGYRYF